MDSKLILKYNTLYIKKHIFNNYIVQTTFDYYYLSFEKVKDLKIQISAAIFAIIKPIPLSYFKTDCGIYSHVILLCHFTKSFLFHWKTKKNQLAIRTLILRPRQSLKQGSYGLPKEWPFQLASINWWACNQNVCKWMCLFVFFTFVD